MAVMDQRMELDMAQAVKALEPQRLEVGGTAL
jgi:hypothetical protein